MKNLPLHYLNNDIKKNIPENIFKTLSKYKQNSYKIVFLDEIDDYDMTYYIQENYNRKTIAEVMKVKDKKGDYFLLNILNKSDDVFIHSKLPIKTTIDKKASTLKFLSFLICDQLIFDFYYIEGVLGNSFHFYHCFINNLIIIGDIPTSKVVINNCKIKNIKLLKDNAYADQYKKIISFINSSSCNIFFNSPVLDLRFSEYEERNPDSTLLLFTSNPEFKKYYEKYNPVYNKRIILMW